MKKKPLGRGLSALLSDTAQLEKITQDKGPKHVVGQIVEIPIDKIHINPYQPRSNFRSDALEELSESIKALGVIQPVTVRVQDDVFQLVSGERRFRASQLAGLKSIPAYVRLANDQEMLEMALVENIQRQDLDAIEIALCFQRLIEEVALTQERLSRRVGKDRTTITNYLRLLKLDPIIQTGIRDGMISMGHGRALISVAYNDQQLELYEKIIKHKLSVRQTEDLVKKIKDQDTPTKLKEIILPNDHKKALKKLGEHLQLPIKVTRNSKGAGRLVISFKDDATFEKLMDQLL